MLWRRDACFLWNRWTLNLTELLSLFLSIYRKIYNSKNTIWWLPPIYLKLYALEHMLILVYMLKLKMILFITKHFKLPSRMRWRRWIGWHVYTRSTLLIFSIINRHNFWNNILCVKVFVFVKYYNRKKCTKYETCAKLHRFHVFYISHGLEYKTTGPKITIPLKVREAQVKLQK